MTNQELAANTILANQWRAKRTKEGKLSPFLIEELPHWMKADFLDTWLLTSNPACGDKSPMELIDGGRMEEVENVLQRAIHGIFS